MRVDDDQLYKISTVSYLTGVRVETLRAWDMRDLIVADRRLGNTRYYTKQQVDRISAINSLIGAGVGLSIGDLAHKPDDEIQQLVAELGNQVPLQSPDSPSIESIPPVVGWQLVLKKQEWLQIEGNEETVETRTSTPNFPGIDEFKANLVQYENKGIDLAIVELPNHLTTQSITDLRRALDEHKLTDCHLICVSFSMSDELLKPYTEVANKNSCTLLSNKPDDVNEISWADITTEIQVIRSQRMSGSSHGATDGITADVLLLLSTSDLTLAGIPAIKLVELYQEVDANLGRAQSLRVSDPASSALIQELQNAREALVSCLSVAMQSTQTNSVTSRSVEQLKRV